MDATSAARSPDHNLIAHEPGLRILGVAAATGRVVEIKRVDPPGEQGASYLQRYENGVPTADRLFHGSREAASRVLDALVDTYWMDQPGQPAPAPAPVTVAAAAFEPASPKALPAVPAPGRQASLAGPIAALAASVMLVGGGGLGYLVARDAEYLAPRDAGRLPALVQASEAPSQHAAAQRAEPQVIPTPAGARRPSTPPPVVALPGQPAQPVPPKDQKAVAAAQAEPAAKPMPAAVAKPAVAAPASSPIASPPMPAIASPAPGVPDAMPVIASEAAGPAPEGVPGSFVERSKAAAATSVTEAKDAKKHVEEVGTDKAQEQMEAMKKVYEALQRSDKITPEMAMQLPHELAQKLREAGAILTPEETAIAAKVKGETSFQVIRLSSEAYDRLKDADGIPTVPAANSWASTGGNVRIPLPGGGDVKDPEDLSKDFHLEP